MDRQTEHERREKIVVWGAGERTKKFLSYHDFYDDIVEIIAVVDANEEKWGKNLENYEIYHLKRHTKCIMSVSSFHQSNILKR